DADIALPVLAYGERLLHFRQLFHLRVDFRRADAHAAGVQRRVRAAMNDNAAMRCDFGEVAMAPDTREAPEIGAAIFRAIGIVPEADRHGRERTGTDEFALLARDGPSLLVPDLDRHAEALRLDFAAPDGKQRRAKHETGNNIGAARNGAESDILL